MICNKNKSNMIKIIIPYFSESLRYLCKKLTTDF